MLDKYQGNNAFEEGVAQVPTQGPGAHGKSRSSGPTVISKDNIIFNTANPKNSSVLNSPQGNNFMNNNFSSQNSNQAQNSHIQQTYGNGGVKKGGPKHILNKFQSQNNNMNYKNNNAMQNYTQNFRAYRGNNNDSQGNSQEPKQNNAFDSRSKNQKIVQNRFSSPSPSQNVQHQNQHYHQN